MTDPGFDPQEAARLALQVQELGFEAARAVVGRFADMFERFRVEAAGAAPEPPDTPEPPDAPHQRGARLEAADGAFRRLQSDAQRALDAYLSVLRRIEEATGSILGPSGKDGVSRSPGFLALPDVAPGGRTSGRVWLHNTTTSALTGVRPWTPGLTTHAGDVFAEDSVTFSPPRLDRLDAGESREILVSVAATGEALGTYHGQILVERLPDISLPISVRVVPLPSAP